jgi:hypothetical protein
VSTRNHSAGKLYLYIALVCIAILISARISHGAYPGDLDGNGTVDWNDLVMMTSSWLVDDCGSIPQGNLDGDCNVDFDDYALLAKDWLKTTPKNVVYHVKNLSDSGPDSFADCLAQAEADGKDSVILFDVGGTISRISGRFDIYEPNLIICGSTAPSQGVTIDLNNNSTLCRVYGSRIQFCDITVQHTAVNSDGISLMGGSGKITVERCSFIHCQDEGVGMSSSYGNIVAFCRIEYCGSQPDDGTGGENGRGILITGGSATMVGNYVYHCNRGITINSDGLADLRNCRIDDSWNSASGSGFTNAGGNYVFSNVIDCVANHNACSGFRFKSPGHFYRSGNSGEDNAYMHQDVVPPDQWLECPDAGAIEHTSPITDQYLPFPYWLEDAVTPVDGNSVGMGTGIPHCLKASDPNPADKKAGVNASEALQWKPSQIDAQTHNVYFGTSYADVSNANISSPEYMGNFWTTNFVPIALQTDTNYYWRVDEVGDYGTWRGDIWRFTTVSAVQASEPDPADTATSVEINTGLSWQSGFDANSHDVYFGINSDAVLNADHGSPEFKGNQQETSFDPSELLYWLTYYWRIDEVDDGGGTVKGVVWNFTTMKDPTMPVADYYVDPNGDDGNLGTSTALAWKTIQKAAEALTAGQTVLVMPGTYPEMVTTSNGGTSGSVITYLAWCEKGPVVIDATGKTNGFKNTKTYVVLDGFEVKNANGNNIVFSNDSADYCIIRNCISHNSGADGIDIDGQDDGIIDNCLAYDNNGRGIHAEGNADGTTIRNCTSWHNNLDGIRCASSDTTISNTIISGNIKWGINVYGTVTVNIDYSDVWGNTSGNYSNISKVIEGGHILHLDPLFVNPAGGDFHLQGGSPCKNTASDGGDMGYRY